MTMTTTAIRRVARNRLKSADQRGFYADVEASGGQAQVTTTIDQARPAPAALAELLGVEPGTPILARDRVMGADGAVLQLAVSYFPPNIAEQLPVLAEDNTGSGGMYARFEEAGYVLDQVDEVAVRQPTDDERQALTTDGPVIAIVRTTRDQTSQQVLEVGALVLAADRNILLYQV